MMRRILGENKEQKEGNMNGFIYEKKTSCMNNVKIPVQIFNGGIKI